MSTPTVLVQKLWNSAVGRIALTRFTGRRSLDNGGVPVTHRRPPAHWRAGGLRGEEEPGRSAAPDEPSRRGCAGVGPALAGAGPDGAGRRRCAVSGDAL